MRTAAVLLLALVFAIVLSGCKRGGKYKAEVAYVAVSQANLRDRVAPVYNKTGVVHNGERVEVLEKSRRFLKVKSVRGEVGWIEERYLVDADVYVGFENLAKENAKAPPQAHGTARASLNIWSRHWLASERRRRRCFPPGRWSWPGTSGATRHRRPAGC